MFEKRLIQSKQRNEHHSTNLPAAETQETGEAAQVIQQTFLPLVNQSVQR